MITLIIILSIFLVILFFFFLFYKSIKMMIYPDSDNIKNPSKSEKIEMLYRMGHNTFGNEKFEIWLNSESIALGGVKPKDLLDNTDDIGKVIDEIIRIDHGVLS